MKLEEKNPNGTVTIEQKEYTTADAMLESFIELGVSHVFVNLCGKRCCTQKNDRGAGP